MRYTFKDAAVLSVLVILSFAGLLLRAQEKQPAKVKASAIQVMMIQANQIALPIEFQVSLYENLIRQLEKKNGFEHVYRDGDKKAASASDLVVVQCAVQSFNKGSETMREVTTVAGATSITVRCQFNDKVGKSLLVRDINGKVRFFGGNLRATYDFAKKAATIAEENFSADSEVIK
jgi:hypothetical protein